MKVLITPNSLKECMSAQQAALAIERGVQKASPMVETVRIPMSDGGDGALDVLVAATGGSVVDVEVFDPLMRPIRSCYGVLGDGITAVVEMAKVSGLALLQPHERNPLATTTYGVGQLIKYAIQAGYRRLTVCIGGSATNDGGAGMLQALGCRLTDAQGHELVVGNAPLAQLHSIDTSAMDSLLAGCSIRVACDVSNPLCGEQGSSYVFAPQKGANPESLALLDSNLAHLAQVAFARLGVDYSDKEGAGAAGGLGFALMAFCGAAMVGGFDLIAEHTGLAQAIDGADLVITAEGSVDAQTAFGKVPVGVARFAKRTGVPTVVLCGRRVGDMARLYEEGVTSVLAIADRPMSVEESIADAERLLSQQAEGVVRLALGV